MRGRASEGARHLGATLIMDKALTITFVGADTYDPIFETGLLSSNQTQEAAAAAGSRVCSVADRVLTVRQGDQMLATENDENCEANAATGSLRVLAALHKAGVLKIASINAIPVR